MENNKRKINDNVCLKIFFHFFRWVEGGRDNGPPAAAAHTEKWKIVSIAGGQRNFQCAK